MSNQYSTKAFEQKYTYTGKDLGAVYTPEKTVFRVWAPTAEKVTVCLYASGTEGTDDGIGELSMKADVAGTWIAEKEGDLNGTYYTYRVTIDHTEKETCDPYAKAAGVNGKRAMVLDLSITNPEGWEQDQDPNAGIPITDAVIYELHVRDLSIDQSAGILNAGKFLGLAETGTKTPGGIPTGLDHIRDLGITHVHLLPAFDYGSVDEAGLDTPQYNWGYDPVNYNVPEGSYSTDPFHGEVRIREMKQMIQTLHQNQISVILDVVYNHVYSADDFCFNVLVPGYFSREDKEGNYSNGSGCGNDTASERSMVKKYIVDSVSYWADEYHIDGFRFDLVGLIDTETINEVIKEVRKKHPNVIFYGEGWTMDTEVTKPGYKMTTQLNAKEVPQFAFFSDTFRDVLKGSVFLTDELGFVSGEPGLEETVTDCFLGLPDWCPTPTQTINYASCHDNYALMDRIKISLPDEPRENRIRMNCLAAAVYLLAEGIPFLHAGEEMLRSKTEKDGSLVENSFRSSDEVNAIKWSNLEQEEYQKVYRYYKGLIAFRKTHGVLRLTDASDVRKHVIPVVGLPEHVVAFRIQGGINGETAEQMLILFNAGREKTEVALSDGMWYEYINGETAGVEALATVTGKAVAEPLSALVLVKA